MKIAMTAAREQFPLSPMKGLWDRVFGLATLTIEHTPYGTIDLPGLTKPHAEMLREIVLQKMRENLFENTQSGL